MPDAPIPIEALAALDLPSMSLVDRAKAIRHLQALANAQEDLQIAGDYDLVGSYRRYEAGE